MSRCNKNSRTHAVETWQHVFDMSSEAAGGFKADNRFSGDEIVTGCSLRTRRRRRRRTWHGRRRTWYDRGAGAVYAARDTHNRRDAFLQIEKRVSLRRVTLVVRFRNCHEEIAVCIFAVHTVLLEQVILHHGDMFVTPALLTLDDVKHPQASIHS